MTKDAIANPRLLENLFEGVYYVTRERLITYWNRGAEKLTGYPADEVTGRNCCTNLIMHVDKWGHNLCDAGRCPAQETMEDGETREIAVSYHHKDGHLIPAIASFIPDRDENGDIIGAIEVFMDTSQVEKEKQKIEALKKLALVDPLTEVANRRCAEIQVSARLNDLSRYGWAFGVLFCDLDGFKEINDAHGHPMGDKVLQAVAKTLQGNLRSSDFVSRWGGDEFLLLLSNVRDETLQRVADKVRRMVEQARVRAGKGEEALFLQVSASVGATLARAGDTVDSLLERADRLMYESKKAGRNIATLDPCAAKTTV